MANPQEEQQPTQAAEVEAEAQDEQELTEDELENVVGGDGGDGDLPYQYIGGPVIWGRLTRPGEITRTPKARAPVHRTGSAGANTLYTPSGE